MSRTKTPWRVEIYFEPFNSHTHTYQVVSDDGLIVAKCGTGGSEVANDAKLIAAAPDLLEALEEILGWQSLAPKSVVERAHAAIAKVKGEK
jgi:hypothetical protein